MTKIDLNQQLLNPDCSETKKLLQSIQGNILKSHGRNFSRHIFLKINEMNEAKSYLTSFTINHVTSAFAQNQQTCEHKAQGTEHIFCNLMLSSSGYDALGLDEHKKPNDSVWRNGMKDQGFINIDIAKILNLVAEIPFPQKNPLRDPPIDKWEETFQQDIHILILLASSDEDLLNTAVENFKNELPDALQIVGMEEGKVIRNDKNQVIEHFGHPDGVSQPLFFTTDYDKFLQGKILKTKIIN